MADVQPASSSLDDDDVDNWMAQRWRDVQNLSGQAEAVGRSLWAQATRAGQDLSAPNPNDVAALGAQLLKVNNPSNVTPAPQGSAPQFVPTQDTPTLAALRQQQTQFKQTQLDPLDKQNSWMAAIALAPTALIGADLPAAFGFTDAGGAINPATDFPDLDAWLANVEKQIGRPLTLAEKNVARTIGRARWAQVNGVSASELNAQVHHEFPLEWSHLIDADPNRLSNLTGLEEDGHQIANRLWGLFRRSLGNSQPTPAQVMAQKLQISPKLQPYIVRPGLPRPPPKPPGGGD